MRRIAAITFLHLILFGLLVGYGALAPAPSVGAYPSAPDLAADYEAYVTQPALVTGTVIQTDPVLIAAKYNYAANGTVHAGTLDLTIRDVTQSVQEGQLIQVYGVVRPERTIDAHNIVTVPARNFLYMYSVSAVAGIWMLTRLIRGWYIDWRAGVLRRRNQPLDLTKRISSYLREVDD